MRPHKMLNCVIPSICQSDITIYTDYLMINLPFVCNFKCLKCFNIDKTRSSELQTTLNLNDYYKKIEESSHLGVKSVVIAGEGEPTLNKTIKEIVSFIYKSELIPVVYTNGSTLSDDLLWFYFNHNVTLVIALDSLNEPIYDRLTQSQGMFHKVLMNIANARKLYSQRIINQNGNTIVQLAINTTISSINHNEIPVIKEFCKDDVLFICNPIARYGNASNHWNELVKDEDEYHLFQKLAKNYSDTGGPLTLNLEGVCGYSRNGISIGTNGDYMTCAYTNKTNGLLGSIKDLSLKEAFEKKYKYESEFYEKYGKTPCLIRDDNFDKYIEKLTCLRQIALNKN